MLAILTAGIGIPFFVLATTAPLIAHWSGQIDARFSPLRFYALSNLGSMLALLSLSDGHGADDRLHVQAWIWSLGTSYLRSGSAFVPRPLPSSTSSQRDPHLLISRVLFDLQWLSLAACASAALLAITNVMCQDVAPVALLWAVPLSLYLISFIICFGRSRWYSRTLCHPLLGIAIILAFTARCTHSIRYQLPAYGLVLLAICMSCHGELVRSKPSATGLKTSFYLSIATGGAIGGCLVGVLAPRVFPILGI